ncbi:hypothetical protein AWJ20_4075 [Sugiyamaella lignohabitans]|uniref:Uncharacterized protein n=1 Tax=Sugiyamaella lignohabitans TaxID=796027 RepID=A0A167C689_9ASCO|nr:uncharacterized protein AWJ20_4075 [Sugiyamaella lignohabitans]ANB11272.1 hypothetical protein AWJ20_4075 [Sugiyamaella lignohabitans]
MIKSKPVMNLALKQVGEVLMKAIDVKDEVRGRGLAEQRKQAEKELNHDMKYSKETFPNLFVNSNRGNRGTGRGGVIGFIDREDGVRRCSRCLWEVPGRSTECPNCGLLVDAPEDQDEQDLIDDLDVDGDDYGESENDAHFRRRPLFSDEAEQDDDEDDEGDDVMADNSIESMDEYDEELDGGFIDDDSIADYLDEDDDDGEHTSSSRLFNRYLSDHATDNSHSHDDNDNESDSHDSFDLSLDHSDNEDEDDDMHLTRGDRNAVLGRGPGRRLGRGNSSTSSTNTITTGPRNRRSTTTTTTTTTSTTTRTRGQPVISISSDDEDDAELDQLGRSLAHRGRTVVLSEDEDDDSEPHEPLTRNGPGRAILIDDSD